MCIRDRCKGIMPVPLEQKNLTVISSYTHTVQFGPRPIIIGERINPTGKSRFKQALRDHDMDYILKEGITQQQNGAHVLDVKMCIRDSTITAMSVLSNTAFVFSIRMLPKSPESSNPAVSVSYTHLLSLPAFC